MSGLNIQPITGFGTGLSEYEYTGYSNVYVQSGISGYLHSGYTYTALTGDPTGILIENSGNTTIAQVLRYMIIFMIKYHIFCLVVLIWWNIITRDLM